MFLECPHFSARSSECIFVCTYGMDFATTRPAFSTATSLSSHIEVEADWNGNSCLHISRSERRCLKSIHAAFTTSCVCLLASFLLAPLTSADLKHWNWRNKSSSWCSCDCSPSSYPPVHVLQSRRDPGGDFQARLRESLLCLGRSVGLVFWEWVSECNLRNCLNLGSSDDYLGVDGNSCERCSKNNECQDWLKIKTLVTTATMLRKRLTRFFLLFSICRLVWK